MPQHVSDFTWEGCKVLVEYWPDTKYYTFSILEPGGFGLRRICFSNRGGKNWVLRKLKLIDKEKVAVQRAKAAVTHLIKEKLLEEIPKVEEEREIERARVFHR